MAASPSSPRASFRSQIRERLQGRRLVPPAWTVAVVAAGGAIGTAARYGLGQRFRVDEGAFPTTTLLENVVGAALLGLLLTVMVQEATPTRWVRLLLATGVLGSFTTFSTFASEAVLLARDGQVVLAGVYVGATTMLGIAAAAGGIAAARAWMRPRGARS